MVRVLMIVLGFLLLIPTISSAADVCPSIPTRSYNISSTDDALSRGLEVVGTGDACGQCADLHVTFSVKKFLGQTVGATMAVASTRTCKTQADLEKYGCAPPCKTCTQEPKISLTMTDGTQTSTKSSSRCDGNLRKAVTQAIQTENADPFDSLRQPQALNGAGPNKDAPLPDSKRIADAVAGPAAAAVNKDPEIQKKIEMDPQMLQAMADGDPKKIEELGKKFGLTDEQAEELAKKAKALNPNPYTTESKETSNQNKGDCLVSTNPIYVLPGKYGPGCLNYGASPQAQAQNWWPAATNFDQPNNAQGQGSQSSNLFSSFGSMLQNLFKKFQKMFSKEDEKKTEEQNTQTQTQFVPELLKPAMALIAQRREVTAGESIFISWSSVRVLADPPCVVSMSGAAGEREIARANNGSKRVETDNRMSGAALFTLLCRSLAKEEVVATTSVAIR